MLCLSFPPAECPVSGATSFDRFCAVPAFQLESRIRAGFPSPAEDFQAKRIDVLEHLINTTVLETKSL